MNWTAAFVGFILAVILSNVLGLFFGFIGINVGFFLAGVVVGLMVGGGILSGFGNGMVAGAFGAIVLSIILIIGGTITAGLAGFAATASYRNCPYNCGFHKQWICYGYWWSNRIAN